LSWSRKVSLRRNCRSCRLPTLQRSTSSGWRNAGSMLAALSKPWEPAWACQSLASPQRKNSNLSQPSADDSFGPAALPPLSPLLPRSGPRLSGWPKTLHRLNVTHWQDVCLSALLVASKLEDTLKKLRDIQIAGYQIKSLQEGGSGQGEPDAQASPGMDRRAASSFLFRPSNSTAASLLASSASYWKPSLFI
jgi:hypothetical protein